MLEEIVRNDVLISSQNSLDKFCMQLKSIPQIVMLQISQPNTVNPKDPNWILLRRDGKTCWHLFSMSNPWCFCMNWQPWPDYKHYLDLHSQACTKVFEIVCQCRPGWCVQDAASMCVQHQGCWEVPRTQASTVKNTCVNSNSLLLALPQKPFTEEVEPRGKRQRNQAAENSICGGI